MEITDDKSVLEANLNELYTRFLLIRKQIESSGMTKELMKQQSDVCFLLNDAIAAVEEKQQEEDHEQTLN